MIPLTLLSDRARSSTTTPAISRKVLSWSYVPPCQGKKSVVTCVFAFSWHTASARVSWALPTVGRIPKPHRPSRASDRFLAGRVAEEVWRPDAAGSDLVARLVTFSPGVRNWRAHRHPAIETLGRQSLGSCLCKRAARALISAAVAPGLQPERLFSSHVPSACTDLNCARRSHKEA